jgi:hypothetical protein
MPKNSANRQYVRTKSSALGSNIKNSIGEVIYPKPPSLPEPSNTPTVTTTPYSSPTPTKTKTPTTTQTRTPAPTRTGTPAPTPTPRPPVKFSACCNTNLGVVSFYNNGWTGPQMDTIYNIPLGTTWRIQAGGYDMCWVRLPGNTFTNTNLLLSNVIGPCSGPCNNPIAQGFCSPSPTPTRTPTPTLNSGLRVSACCGTNTSIFSFNGIPQYILSAMTVNTIWRVIASGFVGCVKVLSAGTPTTYYNVSSIYPQNLGTCGSNYCLGWCPTSTPTPTRTGTPALSPTRTTTLTPSNTITLTPTSASTTSTPTPTQTGTPALTPTRTTTLTPSHTVTPSFGSTQFSVMYTITDPTYEIKGAITESYNNRVYTFTTGSTEVYSLPSFSSVTSLSAIANGSGIPQSEFSSTHKKLFVGNINDTNLHIIDVTADTISTLSITADTFGMALDTNNDLLAIINTSNGGPIDDLVVVIDAATDTVVRTIQTFDTYKGGIASDQNGYCYVVGDTNIMTKVDIINGVTADTINIGDNGTSHKVIYNTTNGYIYTLALNSRLLVWDSVDNSQQANINLSSYSGILDTQSINMVYDSNLDRIYITNKQVGGAIGLITVRCDNNTIVGFTNNLLNSTEYVYASYDTIQNRLYIGAVDQLEVKVLST